VSFDTYCHGGHFGGGYVRIRAILSEIHDIFTKVVNFEKMCVF
jgi:hypothetical protein